MVGYQRLLGQAAIAADHMACFDVDGIFDCFEFSYTEPTLGGGYMSLRVIHDGWMELQSWGQVLPYRILESGAMHPLQSQVNSV